MHVKGLGIRNGDKVIYQNIEYNVISIDEDNNSLVLYRIVDRNKKWWVKLLNFLKIKKSKYRHAEVQVVKFND